MFHTCLVVWLLFELTQTNPSAFSIANHLAAFFSTCVRNRLPQDAPEFGTLGSHVRIGNRLCRGQPASAQFIGLHLLNAQNDVDSSELERKRSQRNALPLVAVVLKDDVGRVGPAPIVVGQAGVGRCDDVRRAV